MIRLGIFNLIPILISTTAVLLSLPLLPKQPPKTVLVALCLILPAAGGTATYLVDSLIQYESDDSADEVQSRHFSHEVAHATEATRPIQSEPVPIVMSTATATDPLDQVFE